MPLSSPDGYLEFTNAVPRAVKMVATSNVGIGTSAPEYALDVHGTSNTGPLTVSSLTITDGAIGGDVSFSGNLAFTSDVTTSVDSNVVVEHRGPHGRDPKAVPLKKYPEIVFDDSKIDGNDTTNTYTQAGYTVSASSTYSTYSGWKVFDGVSNVDTSSWYSGDNLYNGGTPVGTGSGSSQLDTNVDVGEYLVITLPFKIKASYALISPRTNGNYSPKSGKFYAYDGTNWVELSTFTNKTYTPGSFTKIDIDSTTFYEKFAIVSTEITATTSTYTAIGELQLYGYEEDPPAGDTSIDTTFTSVMNTPQTTGANVYVDAKLSTDFTNQVTGPTPVGTAATHNDTGKYWELNGELTSNITVEANTFLSGDAPHSLSMWFNSSNLEANTANTCVFSISDQENLDSYNLDLQSNTWHNLTYSYQGEGGYRVTYLDGRKVAEDQAEDTFGEYPPFAMTGYSQGGYVVSASNPDEGTEFPWKYYDNDNSTIKTFGPYYGNSGSYNRSPPTNHGGNVLSGDAVPDGEWHKIKMPHRLKLCSLGIRPRNNSNLGEPVNWSLYGSNDDLNWTMLYKKTDSSVPDDALETQYPVNATSGFSYFLIVMTKSAGYVYLNVSEFNWYGHRENDLVRLPDPTRVLKYPHIAMTGPAQRGYVVSASGNHSNGNHPTWKAFDGDITNDWQIDGGRYSNSGGVYTHNAGETTVTNVQSRVGDWVQLESQHKIRVKTMKFTPIATYGQERSPATGVLVGSNDAGSTWSEIKVFDVTSDGTPTSYTAGSPTTLAIDSGSNSTPGYYKIHRLIWLTLYTVNQTTYADRASVADLELYGTEEATSVPIQIGGGNIDKVANFRVYDKFVGEDQALEIWDAQKDEFGRAKSSMTLQKGRLGIGTTEPEGRLAVLDEPDPDAYGLQEFPPRGMGSNETLIEGHGVFKASASRESSANQQAYEAFDKVIDVSSIWDSRGGTDQYSESTGDYIGSDITTTIDGGQISGTFIQLEMPYKVKLQSISIMPQKMSSSDTNFYGGARMPKTGSVVGSNDGVNWYLIASIGQIAYSDGMFTPFQTASTTVYSYFRLIAQTITQGAVSTWRNRFNLSGFKLFGYREQVTKQSVLHDGQLTLTKNLTVPRIGPALDADDTPRRDRLVVEYNTSTNPTFEGAVRDTSGRRLDGIMYNGASYDANEKALKFVGSSSTTANSSDKIQSTYDWGSTAPAHTFSVWFKRTANLTDWEWICSFGQANVTGQNPGILISGDSHSGGGNIISFDIFNDQVTVQHTVELGVWTHVVATFNAASAAWSTDNCKIYVNGELKTGTNAVVGNLSLVGNEITLGATHEGKRGFTGSISNFKLYDCALTAQEAKTLYDMGRCDEGHHVVNFSKTRVGIGLGDGEAPTYTLDVRGQIRSQGSLVTSFTGQHKCVPEEPMETGLIVSAKKNQYVKLNGSLDTGKSAITIDESLPIVSLSNVVQDKACFGVVSSTEEANTVYRVETTNGGVISYIPKTLGDNRAIVNSVGEGAIWVVNTGGPLESGDYITTSNVAGYGQKQEDDVLHNYTVAKITMDCDFTGSNVAVQTIKREETGLRTITEDVWNTLVDYDRSSATETQYSNTLDPEAYSGQSGYTPREVTTIVDYTDGSNTISVEEWSALSPEEQETYQSNTTTEIVDYIKFVTAEEWSSMDPEVQATYTEVEIITYYQIMRGENILDENGQLQWEDKTGATESPYERRFLDTDGVETDEANAAHIAAFVGCTYHCG